MRKLLGMLLDLLRPARDSGVVYLTRAQLEAELEQTASKMGLTVGEALRKLDRGELDGTTAELKLRSLLYLMRPHEKTVTRSAA